jgi:EAL domain-containing protein (putative c-di-GMP-specific phosphodiesterase class I)
VSKTAPFGSVADASALDFTFAFQPIIDSHTRTVYSHEALVRGVNNEPAYQILARYTGKEMALFDALCRARAIEVASRTGVDTYLNLNMLPSAAMDLEVGLNSTIEAANRHSFPLHRLIVEATEVEAISDHAHFAEVLNEYRRAGIRLAIDDFGAGYAGLSLLAEFQPDFVKLDMGLVRGIESHGPRQSIVRAIAQVCVDLGIDFVVEGVETVDEFSWFTDLGVNLYQGYLFAKPMFEAMPPIHIPDVNGNPDLINLQQHSGPNEANVECLIPLPMSTVSLTRP